jgi:hypothetical protein
MMSFLPFLLVVLWVASKGSAVRFFLLLYYI